MAIAMEALRRLVNNPKTAKFARSLNHADLPANWADDPEIVQLAGDVYKEQGERSPFFKAWFGDWEAKRAADYAMNGEPVAHLTGNEFQEKIVPLKDSVTDYYQKNYNGRVANPELGEILLNRQGVHDSIGHGLGREKVSGFAAVPETIKNGKIFDRGPNWKNRGVDTQSIIAPIEFNGVPYAEEVILKSRGDTGQYQLYLHELANKKELESAINTPSTPPKQLGGQNQAHRLLLPDKAENVKRASQVVDSEGNPKRFYHGTGADFNAFDKEFQGQNYREGEGGFFFTDQPRKAQRYAQMDAMSRGLAPEQGKVHEVYLNMNKPYMHDVSEEYLSAIDHFDKDSAWLMPEAQRARSTRFRPVAEKRKVTASEPEGPGVPSASWTSKAHRSNSKKRSFAQIASANADFAFSRAACKREESPA